MENLELLKNLNKEFEIQLRVNKKLFEENETLKNNNDILNNILSQIPTKKLCYELVSRNLENYIEVEESDKIIIFTSKGTKELTGKKIILAISY